LVEIGLVVLEKKLFKGKVDAGRTTDRRTTDLRRGISSAGLWPWPGELIMYITNFWC